MGKLSRDWLSKFNSIFFSFLSRDLFIFNFYFSFSLLLTRVPFSLFLYDVRKELPAFWWSTFSIAFFCLFKLWFFKYLSMLFREWCFVFLKPAFWFYLFSGKIICVALKLFRSFTNCKRETYKGRFISPSVSFNYEISLNFYSLSDFCLTILTSYFVLDFE